MNPIIAIHKLRRLAWWLFRPITIGVRAVVVDSAGRILLVRHTYLTGWYLPGGAVRRNESLSAALRRELLEEVGVRVGSGSTVLGLYFSTADFKSDHIAAFIVDDWTWSPVRNREIAASQFVDPRALPDGCTPATKRRIAEYLQLKSVDSIW